jgi:tetratricopeptide (TPR) repeat protein
LTVKPGRVHRDGPGFFVRDERKKFLAIANLAIACSWVLRYIAHRLFAIIDGSFRGGAAMSAQGKHSSEETAITKAAPSSRATQQQSQLDFELDFYEAILGRNPDFVDVLRVHGNNLTLKTRYEDGLKIDRRLVQLRPKDALAHYNLACSYALLKKIDQSLRALRRAFELGYHDFRYVREDRDLAALRKDQRFRQLLREFENC